MMLRLRGVVAPLAAAGLVAAAAACGSSLNSGAFGSQDGGVGFDSGTVAEDGGGSDSATAVPDGSADSGPPLQTGALFVHASPYMTDVRLCWMSGGVDGGTGPGYSNTDPPFPSGTPAPASNYAALPIGGGVALADASSLVGANLTIAAIDASYLSGWESIKGVTSCATLLAPGTQAGSIVNRTTVLYFEVPAGILAGSTSVIALAGCPSTDSNGSVASCGAGWNSASGNLHADVVPLYPVDAGGGGQLGVQVAQLSPALAQLAGDAGAVVSFGPQGGTTPVATLAGEGTSAPAAAVYLAVGTDAGAYDTLGFGVDVTDTDGGPGAPVDVARTVARPRAGTDGQPGRLLLDGGHVRRRGRRRSERRSRLRPRRLVRRHRAAHPGAFRC